MEMTLEIIELFVRITKFGIGSTFFIYFRMLKTKGKLKFRSQHFKNKNY